MTNRRRGATKRTRIVAIAGVATICGGAAAFATHVPQVDPANVPPGFLATHNEVDDIRLSSLARAVDRRKADVFIQHVQLRPNEATPWHTHPGGVFVAVVKGSLTYEDGHHGRCRQLPYAAGKGFFDRGFGHVHRVVAGPAGADLYPVYVLPPGTTNHLIQTPPPEECTDTGDSGDDDDRGDHDDEGDDLD
jgi:hypothetical protein